MNKNLIIGVLVFVIVVLSALLYKGNLDSQLASTIRAKEGKSITEEQAKADFYEYFNKNGKMYEWTKEDIEVINKAYFSVTPAPGVNERPYACNGSFGSFSYNSYTNNGTSFSWSGLGPVGPIGVNCTATAWGWW